MKNLILILLLLSPIFAQVGDAQTRKNETENSITEETKKIVFKNQVKVKEIDQESIYKAVKKWTNNNYNKDIFYSNIINDKKNFSTRITSSVKLLINDKVKPLLYYTMEIKCMDGEYIATISDLLFEYDNPSEKKSHSKIEAEKIISNGGKDNQIDYIQNPEIFYKSTRFFIDNTFKDLLQFVKSNVR